MKLRDLYFLFILLCFSIMVFAADENKSKNQTENQQKTKDAKVIVGKRGQIKTLEEFVPSEEVSADKPVAFPSDI